MRQGNDNQNIQGAQKTPKINEPMKKWATELNRTFSKEEVQMAKKHMEKCSPSLAIKEMQIKTTLRPRTPPPTNAGEDAWKKGTLIHCWRECKLVQPLWKTTWRLLKKRNIDLPI
jgi:hypothetical protein